ncbi:hypothetical protein ACFPK5_00455 [Streptomyces beijiangensis]|uniref:hypothetical protein n=1 Tax=Streptomyces beijiangensis TaxID=163361 RepID=UPI0036188C1A
MTRQLLPAALENRRRDIPVVDSLPAKGFPGYVNGLRRMDTVHDVYGWTNVHAHINMSADEAYALTDKRSPHALYELMLMSAGVTRVRGCTTTRPSSVGRSESSRLGSRSTAAPTS